MKTRIQVNAKINLFLDILKKHPNGYHDVDMVMQSISLCDVVEVSTTDTGEISVSSNYSFDISTKDNIVFKTSELFFKSLNIKNPGINIFIEKGIPVCAGLAGGSADAAATLIGLDQIFKTNLSKSELMNLAANIGADVPFCLTGGTSIATGIGTNLESIKNIPECFIVVAKPDLNVSTKEAYELSDNLKVRNSKSMSDVIKAIEEQNLQKLCSSLYNRFEDVLNIDQVNMIKRQMLDNGALGTSMSGSGPTVFGIYSDETLAKETVRVLKQNYNQTFLCLPKQSGYEIL